MKRLFFLIISLLSLLISCNKKRGNSTDVFTKVYSNDNIPAQLFSIDPNIDNIITGTNGTKIRIPGNSFTDSSGKLITSTIEISLKEVFTSADRVLANLTTTYNGKPLETGGMIYIDAMLNNRSLLLAQNKRIQVALPADSALNNMSLFSGIQDSKGISWENPVRLDKPSADSTAISLDIFEKTTNIKYSVDGFDFPPNFPDSVVAEVGRIAWQGEGLKITKDSVFKIGNHTVRFYKQDRLLKWNEIFPSQKGINSFSEDKNTNYLFELKQLGWANIDRLLDDPRTKEVELVTSIENHSDFNFVYVTLITQRMYLPGYQKKDNTFGFSHSDEEPQELPVGETATIIATAYTNGQAYFAIQKITIADRQTVTLKLLETTVEQLKADVKEKI